MATLVSPHVVDIELGNPHRCSAAAAATTDESPRSSGEDSSSAESCRREIVSGGTAVTEKRRSSCSSSSSSCASEDSEYSVENEGVVDLEIGVGADEKDTKVSVHLDKVDRDCRICHLSLDGSCPESGIPIELGCSCKDDLAAAHKHCAEAWFKIRGNKTCEICGSTARNVVGVNEVELMDQWNDANDTTAAAAAVPPHHPSETRHFWQGHRFLNFLLACMVFAFVISWLFHFNVPS